MLQPLCFKEMNCSPNSLGLRELTTTHGFLLIFDEVVRGFSGQCRVQGVGITPDLSTFAKILAGGLPVDV
ncbi:MAG: hypothetical protein Ct9H300mP19_14030 [Dehalococcoidia bacterium]|nr:MAG: hypothetical protein Ct9H300mP19_14030 [Dehalococcoidia bacterium]